ncbi:MAG: polysaccharide deacetylase family protein [bacterium]|nr:polysaccharide deacetylase family protein [bacterium]
MHSLKKLIRNIFFASCVIVDKFVPSRGVPIFLYHSIDNSGSPISTTPQNFAWQMAYLARHGWFTMTLDELLQLMKANRIPKKRFIITFDDGFRNVFTEALPILQTFGFTATAYIATEFVGRTNSYVTARMPEFPMMTWDDIKTLREAGWQIESHGHTHTNMPELENSKVYWELQVSRDHLEKHAGIRAKHFCYPRGKYTASIVQAVKDADYKSATSIHVGLVRAGSDPWILERLPVNDRAIPLHFKALLTEPYSWFASVRRMIIGRY